MFVSLPKRQAAQQRLWPVEGPRLFEVLERINASSQSKPPKKIGGRGRGEADVCNTSPLGHAFYTVRCEAGESHRRISTSLPAPDLSPWG